MVNKNSYVYILTNQNNKVMYVGVTSNLVKRMQEHISGKFGGFTSKYKVHKLVKYEVYTDISDQNLSNVYISPLSRMLQVRSDLFGIRAGSYRKVRRIKGRSAGSKEDLKMPSR